MSKEGNEFVSGQLSQRIASGASTSHRFPAGQRLQFCGHVAEWDRRGVAIRGGWIWPKTDGVIRVKKNPASEWTKGNKGEHNGSCVLTLSENMLHSEETLAGSNPAVSTSNLTVNNCVLL